jgi:mannose-1-phosphate guanylyltransferase
MKALLLSAGYGTRLRPLTNTLPKCLLPINEKPLLFHWLDLLEKEGVEEVVINIHYLSEKIREAVIQRSNKIRIELFYEPELLGSAGTLFACRRYFEKEKDFLLLYSDNLTDISLKKIIDFHNGLDSVFTTYVYKTDKPSEKGIFERELKTGKVISFEEKPQFPKSNIANAGIGVLNNRIFEYYSETVPLDFGKQIMPLIVRNMYVLETDRYIIDIGSIKDYNEAQDIWKNIQ